MKILICGYGNIGKHTYNEFSSLSKDIYIYDKYKDPSINGFYKNTDLQIINESELISTYFNYAFVCVPTEMNIDGSANVSEIFDIVPKINAKVIIIKSAVPVGTWQQLGQNNVIISPEFYGTTQHSLDSPGFIILGGEDEAQKAAAAIYNKVKTGDFKYYYPDAKTAELTKYMENCWIATKVTFCNEFATIAEKFGIDYNKLRVCWVADERVNPSHTYVYPDKPYYDSHCLNKDIPALIYQCKENNIDTPLMDAVLDIKETRSRKKFTL